MFCLPDIYQRACLDHIQKQISENFVQKPEEMEIIATALYPMLPTEKPTEKQAVFVGVQHTYMPVAPQLKQTSM